MHLRSILGKEPANYSVPKLWEWELGFLMIHKAYLDIFVLVFLGFLEGKLHHLIHAALYALHLLHFFGVGFNQSIAQLD
jgi:hypothetical protein